MHIFLLSPSCLFSPYASNASIYQTFFLRNNFDVSDAYRFFAEKNNQWARGTRLSETRRGPSGWEIFYTIVAVSTIFRKRTATPRIRRRLVSDKRHATISEPRSKIRQL